MAALLAAPVGLLVMAIVQVATELSAGFKDFVFNVGKVWIPGASGIGPYSGKETFLLVGWLVAWAALHYGLRRRQVSVKLWFGVALGVLFVATLLVWPPVWHMLKGE